MTGEQVFKLVWLCVTAWLVACAFLVQGEYGDGYQTIANARHLFGDAGGFYVQRGPLPALALWPAELVSSWLGLEPLDVRPQHLLSAALHSAYLLGCWLCLRRVPGSEFSRLIGLAAAVLTVIFYAYAPYLSHDLLPGLLFVLMIFLAHRWINAGTLRDALLLVLLGAAVTFIKQTYALFWAAIVVFALVSSVLRWDNGRVTPARFLQLLGLAAASAALSWLGYALHVDGLAPGSAFLARPLVLISAISSQYGTDMAGAFAADLYLRNLPNYGIAAMLLVVPGAVLALRGADARMRAVAVCWLVSVVALQFVGFREARYLGFLAPLTAMLIVPVADLALRQRATAILLLAVLAFDQYRGISVAARQIESARTFDVLAFVDAADGDGRIVASSVLSFPFAASSPLERDRYHGIYHLTPVMIERLYEGSVELAEIADPRDLGRSGIRAGDRVYYSNNTLVRRPPWSAANEPNGVDDYLLVAGDAIEVVLRRAGAGFEREKNDGSFLLFVPDAAAGPQMPAIAPGRLAGYAARRLYGDLADADGFNATAVQIKAVCQGRSCSRF